MHVLRNVHRALVPRGFVLDVHPLGLDIPVRAGHRGLGFVDATRFAAVVAAMDEVVDAAIAEGLFEYVRTLKRHVAERFDSATEALERASGWVNLRLPAPLRKRLRHVEDGPVEMVETVRYRLLRKLGERAA